MDSIKNMISVVVLSIVDSPDRVSIADSKQDDGSVLFQIQVAKGETV